VLVATTVDDNVHVSSIGGDILVVVAGVTVAKDVAITCSICVVKPIAFFTVAKSVFSVDDTTVVTIIPTAGHTG
jgi:hypothetical protein